MKKIIVFIFAMFLTKNITAQISVAKPVATSTQISGNGALWLFKTVDSNYFFMYDDQRWPDLADKKFVHFAGPLDDVYNVFKDALAKDGKAAETVTLGTTHLMILTFTGHNEGKYINVYDDNAYFTISENELNKVFGK